MAKRGIHKGRGGGGGAGSAGAAARVEEVPFHETARRRYLNYAISVITSRALPDVRDGLKPVQRRILYTMHHDLHLSPNAKPLKCARIVGEVLGKYHPHGDVAVYESLVRMAQSFSLRYPLVDGHGNFGSLDGDSPAAYRYTEARLQPLAMELLEELGQDTVDLRANYDGRTKEPLVLPARIPQLLVNGATGIAVGMATNIPPHNLTEVAEACEALIADRNLSVSDLLKHVKGPDFPTGGEVMNSRAELRKIYEEGQGAIRLRGEYAVEDSRRGAANIVITSIPYMVQKDALVRSIGELIFQRKLPQAVDVRDESTAEVRIVIELKRDADPELVMAYLYKHTQLQTNFGVNLTCLVPKAAPRKPPGAGADDEPSAEVGVPARVDLKTLLVQFLDFRYRVVERRFRHELRLLEERIHILEGFRRLFGDLDEAVRTIRNSEGRDDARAQLRARFRLDDVQADAILDLRLYRLARLEVQAVLRELKEKKARLAEVEAVLSSPRKIWGIVKSELREVRETYGDERRTRILGRGIEEKAFDEEAFIVDEDAYVLLTRDGWVRRVGRIGDLSKVRLRPDDELLAVLAGNTKSTIAFFSNFGAAYTIRIVDIPPSRGYGDPIQRFFKFRDGERAVGAVSFDPRVLTDIGSPGDTNGSAPPNHGFAVSSSGYALRFALHPLLEPSTRAGRRFARVREGEEVMAIQVVRGDETAILATKKGRVILFGVSEVNFLAGPGRGVIGIKLDGDDKVLAAAVARERGEGLTVYTAGGRKVRVDPAHYRVTGRAGKGVQIVKRGGLARVERPEVVPPALGPEGASGSNGTNGGSPNGD
ncbi:MAG: DNA gyrase/topoisomerase IV subunit A [Planctomycetota bacterium]